MENDTEKTLERELRLNQLYLAIISRYKEYIEEKEHISVAELPALVTPNNELVVKKANEIKAMFGAYNFENNFYEASINLFYFIKEQIQDVSMPLEYWLTPEETLGFAVGDVMDKNILLCSLLVALGNPSTRVLVSAKEGSRKVCTYYEFLGKAYVLDFNSGFKSYANRDKLVESLKIDEETTSYEFNDQRYTEIS